MTSKHKNIIGIERIQYSFVPNHTETIEALARAKFSNEEFRIIMALLRYTNGYLQEENSLSLIKLHEITDISKPHLCHKIKRLLDLHVLSRRDKTVYKVNLPKEWNNSVFSLSSNGPLQALPKQAIPQKLPKRATVIAQTGNNSLPKQATPSDTKQIRPKDNIKDNLLKTTTHASFLKKRGVKPHQKESGIFLDFVSRQEKVPLLNRGKLIKQVRKCFAIPGTTPEKLYECFVWLKEKDSFLKGREPPLIISMLPDKYPCWLKSSLKGQKADKGSTDEEIARSLK